MNFNFLKQKYECEIRSACSQYYKKLTYCLSDNSENEDFCRSEIDSFKKCVKDFNRSFNKKYNGHSYYFLKNDVFTTR